MDHSPVSPRTRTAPALTARSAPARNPWLHIPLQDYERHMSLRAVGQAQMLADRFEWLIKRHSPASVALIGCGGGNGLERVARGQLERVVGVDINSDYLEHARARHGPRLSLQLHCADVQSAALQFEPVELIYAALLFEYVDVPASLATMRRNCRPGGTLAALLQLEHPEQKMVSLSPYESLQSLDSASRMVAPAQLCAHAVAAGFAIAKSVQIELPSGKEFWLQTFRG